MTFLPQRVLIAYGFSGATRPLALALGEGLTASGCTVAYSDSDVSQGKGYRLLLKTAKSFLKWVGLKAWLSRWSEQQILQQRSQRLLADCAQFQPELLMVVRGEPYLASTIQSIRKQTRVAAWWVKNPRWLQQALQSERHQFDAYFSIHPDETGQSHFLAPYTYNEARYEAAKADPIATEILFLGCWSQRREQYLEAIADLPLTLIGPNWKSRLPLGSRLRAHIRAEWVEDAEALKHYAGAKLVVNINQWAPHETEAVNLRAIDVPACGTLLVSDASQQLSRLLSPGQAVLTFATPDELRGVVLHALQHPEFAREVATCGQQAVSALPDGARWARGVLEAIPA
ncbi:glycosyltransferase [Leeia sp.]|uniref:glycosyltransferase family protein n=1 Tax=Leeia sp. TaxID=2884678 RepID=UPI0035B04F7B